jgi:predicted small secreted protein
VKKTIVSTVIATVLAFVLAACSGSAGAKQIVLHTATGSADTQTVGARTNIVGDLDLSDAKIDTFEIVVEEMVPGGSWTKFKNIVAHKGSTSVGFAIIKNEPGDYQYRATVSGKDYGPFTSSTLTVKYKAKN